MNKNLLAALVALVSLFPRLALAQVPAERYSRLCASCHTADPGASFRSSALVSRGDVGQLAAVIQRGRPGRGMPAFGATLDAEQARALAGWLKSTVTQATSGTMINRRIEAESLRLDRSAGFSKTQDGETHFLQWIDRGSHLCYDDVDLTGVRSLEYRYAKGEGEPPRRFAVVAFQGDFGNGRRYPLGEKNTPLTGGWTTFRTERIGLARQLSGHHRLCIIGMGGGGVFNLDWFALSDAPGTNDGITQTFELADQRLTGGGHHFELEKMGEIDGEFWSLDFLDARTLIATQKGGTLWLLRKGQKPGAVEGIPRVYLGGQAGLMHVRAHPDHARNGWVYLSFVEPRGSTEDNMLTIVRGRIRGQRWVDQQVIWRAAPEFFTNSGAHYGARFDFAGDYLFFGIGERGTQDFAQDLQNPFGKIHRIFADGRVPGDNPFARQPGALPTIWTLGHRNPQGLFVDPRTARVWSTEHGPKGGDEINEILPGRNYGWPLVTHGINYDGTLVSNEAERAGFESPRKNWNPSPGLSNLVMYDGAAFPRWRRHLLVASLAHQQLKLIAVDQGRVIGEQVLMEGIGRIRDVIVGPDGLPYVALNQPNGQVYRLRPAH
jgi:glucose/arabinose dehydrogenase